MALCARRARRHPDRLPRHRHPRSRDRGLASAMGHAPTRPTCRHRSAPGRGELRRPFPRQQPRLARQRLPLPRIKAFGWLLVAPLAMPSYVLGFVTMSVFGFTGPVQNQWRDWLVATHGSPRSSRWVARSWSSRSCSTHTSSCWLALRSPTRPGRPTTLRGASAPDRSRQRVVS